MTEEVFDIAIPVLNEEQRLRRGVTETLAFCESHGIPLCLTIADNGSTDGTARVAAELTREFGNVQYFAVGQKGVGRALKRAWTQSQCAIVGYMDVDLATDLKHLPVVVEIFKRHPGDLLVSGSRLLPGAKVVNRTLLREITSRAFNLLLQTALGVRFTDGMCGFKFLRKSTFDRLMTNGVENDDWFFNTEIMVKAEWQQIAIHELPVRWTDDQNSRVRLYDITKKYTKEILRLRRQKYQQQRTNA
jgi:glycosyltransferase involved in cell wall biosynthesis